MQLGKSSKSWMEKLRKEIEPKVVDIPARWAARIGDGRMLIPTPLLIDATIEKIPKGKLATVNTIREKLADDYHADITCPLTTGIFLNIAANAAEEEKKKGKAKVTPYWRVIKENGQLNSKFPGGVGKQADYLRSEGIDIVDTKRENSFVKEYKNKLVIL